MAMDDPEDDPLSLIEFVEDQAEFDSDEVNSLVKKYNLTVDFPVRDNKNIVILSDKESRLYFTADDGVYEYIENIEDWAQNLTEGEFERVFGLTVEDLNNGWIEGSLKDMQKYPPTVYHYTTEEKWEGIQEDGSMNTSYGTGSTNRNSSGVFCSATYETNADGTYGDVCLAIDLAKLKKIEHLERLNLSYEPEVEEYLLADFVASVLDLQMTNEISSSGGMSPDTIIVNHRIPLSCVTEFGN